jgi:hypothetical protein
MESFAPYVETYPVQRDIMYLHLALDCDFKILKAYSKAVYSRKEEKSIAELTTRLNIPSTLKLGIAYVHFKNNQIHRTEGPAVVFEDGSYIWCFWGKVSRLNGPALSFRNDVTKWKVNGLLHRTDGPALVAKKYQVWAINGKFHREDGPAIQSGRTLELLRKQCKFLLLSDELSLWSIEFYVDGLRHRNYPYAAKIEHIPGRPIFVEFWNNGQLIQKLHIREYSELEPYL